VNRTLCTFYCDAYSSYSQGATVLSSGVCLHPGHPDRSGDTYRQSSRIACIILTSRVCLRPGHLDSYRMTRTAIDPGSGHLTVLASTVHSTGHEIHATRTAREPRPRGRTTPCPTWVAHCLFVQAWENPQLARLGIDVATSGTGSATAKV